MLPSFILFIGIVSTCSGEHHHPKLINVSHPLKFPDKYFTKGTIFLPYAEIEEPFDAWYDGPNQRSRIDLYGGTTKTIQRGDLGKYGIWYAIDPWATEKVRGVTCFQQNGMKGRHMKPQPMLPDVTKFKHIGDRDHKGSHAHVYQLKEENGNKMNTYTLYVDQKTNLPVYYKMHGYNNVLHSHYDEYNIQYDQWSTEFAPGVFDEPMKGKKCHGFPQGGNVTKILANPMQEYIHPVEDSHVHHMYEEFIAKHKKQIGEDHEHRKNIFKHNLRYIHSMNRKNLTYRLKINHLADQADKEMEYLRAIHITPREQRGENAEMFVPNLSSNDIANQKDWRLYGAVTQVKDQGTCGSCWSYGVSGTVEAAYFRKTGKLLRFSQQQQVDCSWGYGNNGCYGGEHWRSYKYVMKHGLATEEDYGNYLAINGYCHAEKIEKEKKVNISGYKNIPHGDVNAMKVALFKNGPVAVAMDAGHKAFKFYSNGVYYEPTCRNSYEGLNHILLAVGYGTLDGEPYWLIKNSWSTHWGNDGYFLISTKDNNCGILTDANFAYIN